jgi:hypothetical protein
MLDHLKSELRAKGVLSIPAAWQFVSVDVPVSPQSGPLGLPDVRKLGATYIGTGTTGGYGQVDRAVMSQAASGTAIQDVGSWAPPADGWGVTVSDGAGQYRAVGRMLTLSKLKSIRAGMELAWQTLHSAETHEEMARVVRATGLGDYDRQSPPLVLVVSSMAGGAGASMALDLCRTLAGIPGVDPSLIGVFMVGSDVFQVLPSSARTGVYANALGMLGEIVACQNGAAAEPDRELWTGLGLGRPESVPFGRVFPVGRLSGVERSVFGDGSPVQIYRGLGRALGGLIASAPATEQFVQFDLTNKPGLPLDQDWCGWGASIDDVVWGSLGFASLSMGRDRYAHYAAQRLARGAVDRLISGHLVSDVSVKPSTEQLDDLLRSQRSDVLARVQLWDGTGKPAEWFNTIAWPRDQVTRVMADAVRTHLEPDLPASEAQDGATWAASVRQRVVDQSARLRQTSDAAVYKWAFDYSAALHARILAVVEDAITRFGLPYARAAVDDLSSHFRSIAPRFRELESQYGGATPEKLNEQAESALSGVARVLRNGQALLDAVVDSVRQTLGIRGRGRACGYLASVLEETCGALLVPLSTHLSDELTGLRVATQDARTEAGLAEVATSVYSEWPAEADDRVRPRFDEATNEVLLTSSDAYLDAFRSQVVTSVPDHRAYDDARQEVLSAVISGRWETTGGRLAPGGLLEVTRSPVLRLFPTDPGRNTPTTPQPGVFSVHVRPAEVLQRAREFVERPGESFNAFCGESLRDYVLAEGRPIHEQDARREEVEAALRKTLDQARPLASPNASIVGDLHGVEVTYRYKFSGIPFRPGETVTKELEAVLAENPLNDKTTVLQNFRDALSGPEMAQRIDVFGSYPNYAYLCFDSVLEEARKEWEQLRGFAAREFWRGRRTRVLPGSLPFSDPERRAIVAGWILGQITGHVRVRLGDFGVITAAEVLDLENASWLQLPTKFLTNGEWLVTHPGDALPAVLETVLVASAEVSRGSVEPLRPYRALRRIFDDGASPRPLSAVRGGVLLTKWLRGSDVPGSPSAALRSADADRLTSVKNLVAAYREGLPPRHPAIGRVDDGRDLALRTDLAADLHWALDQIEALVEGESQTSPVVPPLV